MGPHQRSQSLTPHHGVIHGRPKTVSGRPGMFPTFHDFPASCIPAWHFRTKFYTHIPDHGSPHICRGHCLNRSLPTSNFNFYVKLSCGPKILVFPGEVCCLEYSMGALLSQYQWFYHMRSPTERRQVVPLNWHGSLLSSRLRDLLSA